MVSVRNLTRCFVSILVVIVPFLLPVGLYGQVISFNTDLVSSIKKEKSGFSLQKEGYTSKLISEGRYNNIKAKLDHLKQKLSNDKKSKITYKLGDEKEFFVRNILTGNTWNTSSAILGFKSSLVNIWIQKSAYDTLYGTPIYQQILQSFEERLYSSTSQHSVDSEKGVLEILKQYAGEFPDVDGDGVLDVLLLDIQDNFSETGSFVAGFFDPVNLYDFEFSNQRDLIYLDIYPTIIFDGEINVERALSTFAHESQHLIHAGFEGDEPELVFINEGFSEAIEILCGFEPRSEEGYQNYPLRGLLEWNYENPIPDYSRASLWTHYLIEQLGEDILKILVQTQSIGYEGYREVIETSSEYSFEEVFRNWGLALLINDTGIQKEYGYFHPKRTESVIDVSLSTKKLPTAFNGEMPSLVNLPISFDLTSELNFETDDLIFGNSWVSSLSKYPSTKEVDIQAFESSFISSSALKFQYGTIQVLLSLFGEPNFTENERLSFYATGTKSGRVYKRKYGDGSPDTFYRNASYLSLNGIDQRIGIVFEPTQTSYWIKELSIRTLFESELEGSNIDGNEIRDFELDIYNFKDGKPQQKIIPTTRLEVKRESGKLIEEIFSLSDFYDQLSTITDSIIIVIGNDEDDQNFIALGMDESSLNASFFSENLDEWVSLSEKSIGGNSLSNWNPIIQLNAVVPEVYEEQSSSIQEVEYNYNEVLVKVSPKEDHDTTSVNMIAELPDGSFSLGKISSELNKEYLFKFPVLVNGSYTFIANYQSTDGGVTYSDQIEWSIEIPDGFDLSHNYPNPFNPSTTIPFILLEEATIEWEVFDVIGRKVMEVPPKVFSSGEYSQEFNLSGLASGMYLARAILKRERDKTPKFRTQKIMLIK